jgi:hypothetical protein
MMSKRGTRVLVGVAVVLGALVSAWSGGADGRAGKADALPADLALVSGDAAGFVSVRLADLRKAALGKKVLGRHKELAELLAALQVEIGVPLNAVERATLAVVDLDEPVLIVRTAKPYVREKVLARLGAEARVVERDGKSIHVAPKSGRALYLAGDRVFVAGRAREVTRLLARPARKDGPLAASLALAAGKEHHVVLGLRPEVILAALSRGPGRPELPEPLLAFKPLLQARTLTATLDAGAELKLDLRLAYADEDVARDGATALKTALYVARELVARLPAAVSADGSGTRQVRELARVVGQALKSASVEQRRGVVQASVRLKVEAAHLAAVAFALREAELRTRSSNNLKQMALAFHNYNDVYGGIPANAIYSKDGKALLSWRVAILPFIEEDTLYKQFKLDEAWDGPNNKTLLARMPKVYAPVAGKTKVPYGTFYQVFTGPDTPFNPKAARFGFPSIGGSIPRTFPDGTSNTLLIVEAGEAVPWTRPEDIPYDAKKPLPKLGGQFPNGFFAAFADGSVKFLRKDFDEATMRNLINPADGNVIDLSKVLPKGVGAR